MIANATALKRDPDLGYASVVNYLGLLVELINAMEHCSLVRYRGQELVSLRPRISRAFRVLQSDLIRLDSDPVFEASVRAQIGQD